MAGQLTGLVIKCEKTTATSVSNFSQGLGEYETIGELLEALVNWINSEMDEEFVLFDNSEGDIPESFGTHQFHDIG
jgi:hypothetical protein